MSLTYNQTAWEQLYRRRLSDPATGELLGTATYGRAFFERPDGSMPFFERRLAYLEAALGWDAATKSTARILIGGCAFGFLIEVMQDAGYQHVWGVDESQYVIDRRGAEARGDVLFVEDDIRGGGRVRAALRSLTGDDVFDWVIDEDAISSFTDSEIPQMIAAMESVLAGADLSRCVHVVTPSDSPSPKIIDVDQGLPNWKTPSEYKAFAPDHTWINHLTGEVI